MNPQVDQYLIDGCGRCSLYQTPECKVHTWIAELEILRSVLLETELVEEVKWSMPTYTLSGKNVLILSAFKDFCSLNFFKGSLIKAGQEMLEKAGPNSHVARLMKFTSVQQIEDNIDTIKAVIQEAIDIEKAGKKVEKPNKKEELPEELMEQFEVNPDFEKAFKNLTPGRQRGYIIYFSGAKQSKTRTSRIEKYMDKILAGKGFHD